MLKPTLYLMHRYFSCLSSCGGAERGKLFIIHHSGEIGRCDTTFSLQIVKKAAKQEQKRKVS